MIGSIPSHSDQGPILSDDYLYPQQPPMYASTGYDGSNPGSTYVTSTEHSQYQYPVNGNDGVDHTSDLFQQSTTDVRQGSFADVGAAFGFHPDLPIQISSHNLPQSTSSHFDGYANSFQHQPQLFAPLPHASVHQPVPEDYAAPWTAGVPNSVSRHGKRQRRSAYDSDEDEANEPGEPPEGFRKPTRLCVG